MRLLVVLAHPSHASLGAVAARAVVETGQAAGHQVDLWDLQAEGYDPVMGPQDWQDHMAGGGGVPADLARLARAEAVIVVYPTWWGGPPALLKGWFDKV